MRNAAILTGASAAVLAAIAGACTPSGANRKLGAVDAGQVEYYTPPGSVTSVSGPTVTPPASAMELRATGRCEKEVSKEPGTQVHGLTIPAKHPRLWWTPERVSRAKSWLSSHPVRPDADDPMRTAFLHVVSGADCSSAIKWATGFTIPEKDFAVASDHVRWNGENAIVVYDWCFDQLNDEQKKLLLGRWNEYFGKAKASSWGGPHMPSNNYYWGYLRNELEWGIATHGENPQAPAFLEHALVKRFKQSFLPFAAGAANGDGRGGVPQEGTQYGVYMLNYPVNAFGTAGLLGRSLYDETDWFKAAVFYLVYATTPAPTTAPNGDSSYEIFPFNDDQKWNDHESTKEYGDFMTQAAMTWDCLPVGKYARGWLKKTKPKTSAYVASVDRGGEGLEPTTLPLDYWAPGPKHFFGRSAWGPGATVVNWQLGDYEKAGVGHFHYDMGSFQIWRNGRWLSRESTGYSDTFTGFGGKGDVGSERTHAHNGILVNGLGLAQPSSDGVEGPPEVRRLESQPEYAYADVDLTKAYRNPDRAHPERDNPGVAHVERELLFVRSLETTVILDRVTSRATKDVPAEKATKTFLAHFEGNPTVEDPSHVTYTSGKNALRVTVLVPKAPETRVIDEKSVKNAKNGQYRLEVTTSGAAQSYLLTVLQAKDAAAPALAPTVTEDDAQFTVKLDGATSIVFKKGQTSSGGSITIGGKTRELRKDVQGIKVTDTGPEWL